LRVGGGGGEHHAGHRPVQLDERPTGVAGANGRLKLVYLALNRGSPVDVAADGVELSLRLDRQGARLASVGV
jgi:hypothetical protein